MKLTRFGFLFFLMGALSAKADTVHIGVKYSFKTAYSTMATKKPVKQLYKILKDEPLTKLQISGHTDWIASDEINQELSEARAKTVYDILIQYGLGDVDIKTIGFGKKAPVADNRTVEGRAQNRRVSVTVTNLSREQANRIVELVEKSEFLFIIEVENDQVAQSATEESPASAPVQPENLENSQEVSLPVDEVQAAASPEDMVVKQEEEPNEVVNETKSKRNRYYIGANLSQSYLVAEDITGPGLGINAYWVSKVNVGLAMAYQWELMSKLWFGINAKIDKQSYYDQDNTSYNWDKKNPLLFAGTLMSNYDLSRISFNLDLDFKQIPFLQETGLDVELEKEWTYGITAGVKYKFFKGERLTSRLGLDIIYTLGSFGDYHAQTDPLGFVASLDVSKLAFKTHEWLFKLSYGYTDFSHNYNAQNYKYFGFDLSLRSDRWF